MSSRPFFTSVDARPGQGAEERAARANRRRLIVFVVTFVVVAIVGLVYDYARPAVYESTVRLNFVPAAGQRADDATRPGATPFALRDEAQYLTSRTLLAKVWERLKETRGAPATSDPPADLQAMLTAEQVAGTNIVVLKARGGQPAFLAALLDRLVATYRADLALRYRSASSGTLGDVDDEARKLDAAVVAKHQEVDAFRARYNIVSIERDENQVLSEVKGTGTALNAANEKLVAAEAKLGAVQEAQGAGRSVTRARDNPTLASLEQQAASIRAELKEVAGTFTPQYMQIDPRIRALRDRLANLEQQIVEQRAASQQNALQEAREEVASSRAAVASLRQQLAGNQQSVQAFTSRFGQFKALQEELTRIETLRQKAVERLTALRAEETGRTPKVEVVEPAAVPTEPASPPYGRDAAIALLAALLAGLATMAIVELFNRPPRQPAAVVLQPAWSPALRDATPMPVLADERRRQLAHETRPQALAAPTGFPRELAPAELAALADTATGPVQAAVVLLSIGLTRAEVVALRRRQLNRHAGSIRIGRTVPLPAELMAVLPAPEMDDAPNDDGPLLVARDGTAWTGDALDAALLYAAHDAGLDAPEEVTAAALHHTYVAFLVRQGVRFSDLVEQVGPLPADELAGYARLAPAGPRLPIDTIDRYPPLLRDLPAT